MALLNIHSRGWWDTNAHISVILKADEFLGKLVFRHLNDDDLTRSSTEIVTAAVTIFCNARYLAHNLSSRPKDYIESLVIGEMMAPVLPTRLVLPQDQARLEFVRVMEYIAGHCTVYTRNRTLDTWFAEINEANEALEPADRVMIPARDAMAFDDYVQYLIWLAMKLPVSQYMNPVQLVVTSYVGVAKRGTMSDGYVSKVINGIKDDLGIEILLDAATVKSAYVNFGRYVNATNAEGVFNNWLNAIPEHALRLRLCLEQVSGSGLTAYIIVGRAYRKYPVFPWDKLNTLTGGEMNRYIAATTTVDGNAYYGFNRDLGAARSTLFSSVAYVAKELLIKIAGEVSLSKYQGWIKKPKNPIAVGELIEAYITRANDAMAVIIGAETDQVLMGQYDAAIHSAVHNNMFA